MAIAAPGGRANRDKDGICLGDMIIQPCGKMQSARLMIAGDQHIQTRLVNRDFPCL